jgi:hypothetical protein
MRMKLHRLLRLAPLALLFASVASAQTIGTVIGTVTDQSTGKPVVGALVVATSASLQGEQTSVTDKSGQFRIQALPPGDYKLSAQFEGYKAYERSDIRVSIDKTIRANLALVPEAVQLEEQVVKTGVQAPVINLGSAETGAVVTKDFISDIPQSRGFQNIAFAAPTATFDLLGISFGGTTSNENNYLIDGLSVNNPAFGTLGAQILNNFVEEIDVKTGSFMPEYGFSSGGIVNVVTKSGSNEFHGSVFGNYQPGALRPEAKGVSRAGEAVTLQPDNKAIGTFYADYGFEVGGPIMKDRLWFYAGAAPVSTHTRMDTIIATSTGVQVSNTATDNKVDQFQYVGKLTYLFNENNTLSFSGIYAPRTATGLVTTAGLNQAAANGTYSSRYRDFESSFGDLVARFTSKLLDKKLLIEAIAGWHSQSSNAVPKVVDGVDQASTSITTWSETHPLSDFVSVPSICNNTFPDANDPTITHHLCEVTGYSTGGMGAYDKKNQLDRYSGKVSGSYLFDFYGSHQAKVGVEVVGTQFIHTKAYGGNAFFNEVTFPNGLPSNLNPASFTDSTGVYLQQNRGYGVVAADRQSYKPLLAPSVTSVSTSQGYYAQDSYSPTDGLTVNAGLRWEMQQMGAKDLPGSPSFNINNNFAPRFQAIYDWTKQGRSKVSVNWGRFYENIPLDMGDRAFGLEQGYNSYIYGSCVTNRAGTGSAAGSPNACQTTGLVTNAYKSATRGIYTYGVTGAPAEPVAPNLQGQYGDTFGAGVEYEVLTDLSLGLDYTGRRLGQIIEDASVDDGNTYFISNPGTGSTFTGPDGFGGTVLVDPKNATAIDPVTGLQYTTKFPKPVRDYDAVSVTLRKNMSNHWQALASYTYSSLRGNYPGLFSDTNGQTDPNLTSMFDLVSLLANQKGPLPADTPHAFKVAASYTFDISSRFSATAGGTFRATSGRPVNYLGAHPVYGPSEAFILPRGSGGRTPVETDLDLKGMLSYVISPPYAVKFSVDVINVLNNQVGTSVDEDWTLDSVQPIRQGACGSGNAAEKSNKIGAALADCPALQYLRTSDGRIPSINKNWGQPSVYLAPLAVRFGLQVTF